MGDMNESSIPRARDPLAAHAERREMGMLREIWKLLSQHRKRWLAPLILFLLLLAAFVVLGATPVAPFIYALF